MMKRVLVLILGLALIAHSHPASARGRRRPKKKVEIKEEPLISKFEAGPTMNMTSTFIGRRKLERELGEFAKDKNSFSTKYGIHGLFFPLNFFGVGTGIEYSYTGATLVINSTEHKDHLHMLHFPFLIKLYGVNLNWGSLGLILRTDYGRRIGVRCETYEEGKEVEYLQNRLRKEKLEERYSKNLFFYGAGIEIGMKKPGVRLFLYYSFAFNGLYNEKMIEEYKEAMGNEEAILEQPLFMQSNIGIYWNCLKLFF